MDKIDMISSNDYGANDVVKESKTWEPGDFAEEHTIPAIIRHSSNFWELVDTYMKYDKYELAKMLAEKTLGGMSPNDDGWWRNPVTCNTTSIA